MDLDPVTGATVTGWTHVVQSLETILTTPKASRVFNRDFGSAVPDLVDAPMNDAGVLALYVATAEAIAAHEPRFDLTGVQMSAETGGRLRLSLRGAYRPRAHLGDFSTVSDGAQSVSVRLGSVRQTQEGS